MGDPFPCHIAEWHQAHWWTPLVADPDEPRVLWLMGESVWCPGADG